jgi:hypothetical protein
VVVWVAAVGSVLLCVDRVAGPEKLKVVSWDTIVVSVPLSVDVISKSEEVEMVVSMPTAGTTLASR